MTRTTTGMLVLALSGSGLLYACAADSLSSFDGSSPSTQPDAGAGGAFGDASSAPGNALTPVDNAVILVHAAKTPSFRLCFLNELDRKPQPDSQVMPEANVVGVEVGNAVRIGPLHGAPGRVYLFGEATIRALYPAFGGSSGAGPSCGDLLGDDALKQYAQDLGEIDTDLSRGVHLLVVKGCSANSPLATYSLGQCGDGWTADKGNLTVTEITLEGANRTSADKLPTQVVNLSQPLEGARAGRDVVVSFGDLTDAGAAASEIATNPPLFEGATPAEPVQLAYEASDLGVYDSYGFRVAYSSGDAGAPLLSESLARVQKQSSPRDLPPTYYAAASNYALLLLGDPSPTLVDGGADDDERRSLHFLAVPVIAPNADDGGEPAPDGGT
jgi:hypothetical protein